MHLGCIKCQEADYSLYGDVKKYVKKDLRKMGKKIIRLMQKDHIGWDVKSEVFNLASADKYGFIWKGSGKFFEICNEFFS